MSLTVIRDARRIRQFLVYDLEWIPGTLEVRMVGVYDGESYRCYRTVAAFLANELTSSNRGKWFYAHAGGLADFQFILNELYAQLREKHYRIQALFSGSSAIINHIQRGHNAWWLLDSYWLLKDKLSNIAKWSGEEKGGGGYGEDFLDPDEPGISDEEFEQRCLARREWYATVSFEKLRIYNERDCVILWNAIKRFQDVLLSIGGQLQMTLASCSMQLFRRSYLTEDIETSKRVNRVAQQAYTASRVELMDTEVQNGYYYDINSSFPYAMTHPLPGRYLGRKVGLPDDGLYIAKCKISVPEMYLPPIPYRLRERVFFPTGEWEGWLSNIDIESLIGHGGQILECRESLTFAPFDDCRQFALDIYARRRDSTDDYEKVVLKFLLNSLYGKFAESERKEELLIDPTSINRETMMLLMPGVWLAEKLVKVPHAHVPISVHITAIARRVIGDWMAQCQDVQYCDTDGFSTTSTLPTGKELGQLKLEKMAVDGLFVAPKVYRLHGKVLQSDGTWKDSSYYKAKGFSRMTASRFARVLEGESISYERMRRIRENLKHGTVRPTEYTVLKRLQQRSIYSASFDSKKHSIPKRFPYPDGSTRPWDMSELRRIYGE